MQRSLIVALVFAAALIVAAPSAQAATVSVSVGPPNVITFQARHGEVNSLDVDGIHSPFTVSDSIATLTPGSGCLSLDPHSADCSSAGLVATVNAHLRDQDDTAHVQVLGHANVWGGRGDDTLYADSFGQSGTSVYGGRGDDDVTGFGEGGQIADGGPGDDVVHAGGASGSAGAASGFGGPGRDTIYYIPGFAPQSRATLDGGNGDDTIIAQPAGFPSTASGGNGDDLIEIEGGAPGGPAAGAYTISGGAGGDVLIGGVGDDTVDGGTGRDFIDVRGGGADTVTCGAGRDVVLFDASDTISRDCEIARLG